MEKKLIPNSTQIPNIIADFLFPRIPEAEMRCMQYICRRTFGFHKEQDRISFTQFINGIKSKEGKVLDYGCGLCRQSVNKGLKNLESAGAIFIKRDNNGNYYKINLEMDVDKVVYKIDQSIKQTSKVVYKVDQGSQRSRPKVVNVVDLQNKEKQSIQNKDVATQGVANLNEVINLFKEVNPTYEEIFKNITQRKCLENLIGKFGREKVVNMIRHLPKNNATKYAPIITKPTELRDKLGKLVAFIQQEKNNNFSIGKV
jgi:hypothetical protein